MTVTRHALCHYTISELVNGNMPKETYYGIPRNEAIRLFNEYKEFINNILY